MKFRPNTLRRNNKYFELKNIRSQELVEKPIIAIKAKFSSSSLAKFIRYLNLNGFRLIGTNISNEEYYFNLIKKNLLDEAKKMNIKRANSSRSSVSVFGLSDNFSEMSVEDIDVSALFTQNEILCIINNILKNMSSPNRFRRNLIDELIRKGIINEIYPLHDKSCVDKISFNVRHTMIYPVGKDVIDYFGMEVAFYFEWINFYWRWLLLPSCFGLITYFVSLVSKDNYTISSNPFTSIYSAFTIIWGFLFIKFWTRHKMKLDIEWNSKGPPKNDLFNDWDPITEKYKDQFSATQQKLRYLLSFVTLTLMLFIGFSVTIFSFNLRGIVSETTQFGTKNILFIQALHKYSQKSQVFDTEGPYYLVPVFMHSTLLYLMNSIIFKRIAVKLTDMENHRKESDYFYFFIIKRFVFDSLDWYFGLFYLAFVELDINKLRNTLHVLFISDVVRHTVLNCVLPWVTQIMKSHADRLVVTSHMRNLIILELWNNINRKDTYMDSYDSFDDYLNFVIKYGYIVLFAAVSPMTAQVAFLSNIFIVKTDIIKILYLFKRPRVTLAHGTEPWMFIANGLTWLSIITNILIFGFSSHQMYYWFPKYFIPISVKQRLSHKSISEVTRFMPRPNKGIEVCGILILLEHMFIIVGVLIHFGISSVPKKSRQRLFHEELLTNKSQSKMTDMSSVNEEEIPKIT